MNKYQLRYTVIDEYGYKATKYETVYGELGSKFLDKNGKEIFDGDTVILPNQMIKTVRFKEGAFLVGDELLSNCASSLEVVVAPEDLTATAKV